jgi:hypothetical protein
MYWKPVPDAILRTATVAGVPSASVAPELLNASAVSVIHPSVPSPDFSVDDQISTAPAGTVPLCGTTISNSSMSGRVSARLAPVGGGIDALRVTWLSTQPMSSASSSRRCVASVGSSGSDVSSVPSSPQAAAIRANPANAAISGMRERSTVTRSPSR